MNKEYKPITNLWKDSEGYRYFGTLKLSSKIKYDGDDFIPLWEWINQLQKENKILKENAENNDKVVDKVNWENMLLKKENKQLKEDIKDVDIWNKLYNEQFDKNRKLEDNWNKLKEWVNKHYDYYMNNEDYVGGRLCFTDMKDKMQELEGSDSNE